MPVAFFLASDQPVLHAGRRATFLHMSRGKAIIRYWGGSHAVSVSPEALSPLPARIRTGPGRPLAASDQPITRDPARTAPPPRPPVRRSA
jgi:hypothetical protein